MKKIISTSEAPAAIGAYSQGIVENRFVFTSGQIGINPKTGELVEGSFKREADQVLRNLFSVLKSGGCMPKQILKLTVFLTDLSHVSELNELLIEYFKSDLPARSTVEVCALPKKANIEIEAVGVIS